MKTYENKCVSVLAARLNVVLEVDPRQIIAPRVRNCPLVHLSRSKTQERYLLPAGSSNWDMGHGVCVVGYNKGTTQGGIVVPVALTKRAAY